VIKLYREIERGGGPEPALFLRILWLVDQRWQSRSQGVSVESLVHRFLVFKRCGCETTFGSYGSYLQLVVRSAKMINFAREQT
jgi:hypothetical protein